MGESFGRWTLGDDAALMPHLSSANIACGYHGGDPHVMRRTVALALEHGVGIGAHVGLPDLIGFGRRRLAVGVEELEAAAAAGVPFVPEGYVDLDYDADGKLVLERVKQMRDPQQMGEKAVRLLGEGKVRSIDGVDLELAVESICVHGDAPNAPEIAKAIRAALAAAGIDVAPLSELRRTPAAS